MATILRLGSCVVLSLGVIWSVASDADSRQGIPHRSTSEFDTLYTTAQALIRAEALQAEVGSCEQARYTTIEKEEFVCELEQTVERLRSTYKQFFQLVTDPGSPDGDDFRSPIPTGGSGLIGCNNPYYTYCVCVGAIDCTTLALLCGLGGGEYTPRGTNPQGNPEGNCKLPPKKE